MVIDNGFSAFGDLLAQQQWQCLVNCIAPKPHGFGPKLYGSFLLRSLLVLSFETAECWRIRSICANFCSREQGCNDICMTSRCATMLFLR